jgi:O-antigen ligase
MSRLKPFLSWCAVVIIGLSLISVLGTYVVSNFQPFRGPSKAYFWIFLFASLLSSRLAIWLIIFSLPLMPSFHLQLEFITHPAVKYFFSYSAADAVVGLFLGLQLKHCFVKRKFISVVDLPPWPFGLLLLVLTCSTALAISRNIWQSASAFLFSDLMQNVFNYKLINSKSDYLPIADLIIFGLGVLLAMIISRELKNTDNKNLVVFKPLVLSLLVSASWGVLQSLTGFGLGTNTTTIRPDFFGYGALGFQPDIHAFAGLMIIGAVGLTGFLKIIDSKFWRILTIATSVLCWVAIILSKSRASLGLAILMAIALALLSLRHVQKARLSIYGLLVVGILALLIYITQSAWVMQLYETYLNDRASFLEVLNLLSSWRLDLHAAAIRMWSHFPLLGIGQGNLYRVSPIYEFSGSALMARLGGENAHNYFLQTLAEIGLVGLTCYVLFLVFPLLKLKSINKLSATYIAIFALFLGNIYSHSLIIRENYYLLMVLIGSLYAYLNNSVFAQRNVEINLSRLSHKFITTIGVCTLLTICIFFIVREITTAYDVAPYSYGRECYRETAPNVSGWNGGRYSVELPPHSHGVILTLHHESENQEINKLSIRFDLFDKYKNSIADNFNFYRTDKKIILNIAMKDGGVVGQEGGFATLSLLNCLNKDNYSQRNNARKNELKIADIQIF